MDNNNIAYVYFTIFIICNLIIAGITIGIVYQSKIASCDKCLWTLNYEGAAEQLDYELGKLHPLDMLEDLKNGCTAFNKLE